MGLLDGVGLDGIMSKMEGKFGKRLEDATAATQELTLVLREVLHELRKRRD